MDKRLINAVAGSGKTQLIINQLSLNSRILIITYTQANQASLKKRVQSKYGYFPSNIHIFGYWEFLYNFCIVPFTTVPAKGIIFDSNIIREIDKKRFWSTNPVYKGYFISKYLSKALLNTSKINYKARIEKYFDSLYIDEVQDFSSDDLDWIMSLSKLNIPVTFVGDFYQKTYSTSQRGNKGKGIFKKKENWINLFKKYGFIVDNQKLIKSRRCSKTVCNFIMQELGIEIHSYTGEESKVGFIDNVNKVKEIMIDDNIVKLFYNNAKNFKCNSMNWGESKGLTFENVCVVLNKRTYDLFNRKELAKLAPTTKAKFYVACTRSKHNLYFIDQNSISKFKKY